MLFVGVANAQLRQVSGKVTSASDGNSLMELILQPSLMVMVTTPSMYLEKMQPLYFLTSDMQHKE
ncbi:hypothetical protein [Sphingobacterium mizutaii]|uniref:hypothetical protein n=1 Tax=Sphingobacterium mizutaii TaxID=1010 RepID=UPI0028A0E660|nr:hypothetical protein [Sphingobacterium mizutaii]